MIVVSDSSPLIALAKIDQIEVLFKLYSEIRIPKAVYNEITNSGKKNDDFYYDLSWLIIGAINDAGLAQSIKEQHRGLHDGEIEAIVLANELGASLLLMDELAGRDVAEKYKIKTTGVLGILLSAKAENLIESYTTNLDKLISAGFYVSQKTRAYTIRLSGE